MGWTMDEDGFRARRSATHEIGEKLDDLSIDELDRRLALLRSEIERIEAVRAAKQVALAAADSVFKF